MLKNKAILGGRYQYNPNDPIRQTQTFDEFRVMDKSINNRSLVMQLHHRNDKLMETLRDFKHPYIIGILDIITVGDQKIAYILQPGVICSLDDVLSQVGYVQEDDALVLFKFMLLAVQQLHQKLIPHFRLCSQNFVFTNPAALKIGHNLYEQPMEYKAPELLKQGDASYSSDIFSLGVILYRMIYGCVPFNSDNEDSLAKEIKYKNFQKKQTKSPLQIVVSKEVHYLLLSMLDYFPENRPSLESILENSHIHDIVLEVEQPNAGNKKKKVGGSIIPEGFYKKYLVFKQTKIVHNMCGYYNQCSYMAVAIKQKTLMTLIAPEYKMYETEPRKIESYYEKLRALEQNYTLHGNQYICRVDSSDRFRQEPVIAVEYCNQGNLYDYLEKRKISDGWLTQQQIHVFMYIMAMGLKQYREAGIDSLHTLNYKTIMISNCNIKIREPALLSPSVQRKLIESKNIDFFAPELKDKLEFVQFDKSDMWSFGVLYYYLIEGKLPELNEENQINIKVLKTSQKNRNLIAKCLEQNVGKRLTLESVKIDGVDQKLLEYMLKEKQAQLQQQQQKMEDGQSQQSEAQDKRGDKKVMFKNRRKRLFKHYNKIIAESGSSNCRVWTKVILTLIMTWIVFFGMFFVNGGVGLLRTNYYRPVTLEVVSNYGTRLYNLTILTTSGSNIQTNYNRYAHQQFTDQLRCAENNYTQTTQSHATVDSFINSSAHSLFCFFGFVYAVIWCILYGLMAFRLDLPTVIVQRQEKKTNRPLYHLISLNLMMPSLLFCFFYIWAYEYQIQTTPCLGIQNLAYPQFTSITALLTGNMALYFVNVFLTVILWSILMFVYGYVSILAKKVNTYVYEWVLIIPTVCVMVIYLVICRVGFGGPLPIEPTWSFKINLDITLTHWGFFGFFPEVFYLLIFLLQRLVDFVFWVFLKLGLEPPDEQNIDTVGFLMVKAQPTEGESKEAHIGMIEHKWDFELDGY